LKTKAADILQKGVERMQASEQLSPTLVAAVVSLAQIFVDTGQPEKAIEWLENETVGPLKLLNEGNEAVYSSPQMPIEIYKLALRSYVAVQPQRLEDAEKVMIELERAVSQAGDDKASENLTQIYMALGRELQQQLEELRNTKKQAQLKAVSEGFESFLKRIVERDKGNTWNSLTWAAETFHSLGSGYDDEKSPVLTREAKQYYLEAVKAYQSIIAHAQADQNFAPKDPNALDGVRLRLALCQRKIGQFDEAIKTIVSILKVRPMMLPAQVLGAETYQTKGATDKDSYGLAILGGGDRDAKGRPIIWGWAKISKLTQNQEKFEDTFHLARIKLSECRYLYAMMIREPDREKEKTKRRRTLTAAREDMWVTYKLYPKLGGKSRTEEYNRLLIKIQKALGDQPLGLDEFGRRNTEAGRNDQVTTK
jgi:tetratricopeptide (TPR) repeat protein